MNQNAERRFLPAEQGPVDMSTRSDGKQVISGYSAVFYKAGDKGTEYRLWEDLVERIREGAFDRAIKEKHDVRGLFNHDPNNLLGRSTSGSCTYSVDKVGLKYEITVDPEDPDHQRVLAKIKRGDLTGSSFAFRPTKVTWEDNEGADSVRWIEDLNLYDVGPVTYPAYEASTTGLRSEDGRSFVEEEYRLWKETQSMKNEQRTEDEVKPEAVETQSGSVTEETITDKVVEVESETRQLMAAVKELTEVMRSLGAVQTRSDETVTDDASTETEATTDATTEPDAESESSDERSANTLELKRRMLWLQQQKCK